MIEPIVMIANRVRTGPPTHQYRPPGASARRHANALFHVAFLDPDVLRRDHELATFRHGVAGIHYEVD